MRGLYLVGELANYSVSFEFAPHSPSLSLSLFILISKILTDNTTILEHQNNKQKLQILEALHIRNMQLTLNRINFQTSANVLKCI